MITLYLNVSKESIISQRLPWEYQKEWVIVFGKDLAYNLQ